MIDVTFCWLTPLAPRVTVFITIYEEWKAQAPQKPDRKLNNPTQRNTLCVGLFLSKNILKIQEN